MRPAADSEAAFWNVKLGPGCDRLHLHEAEFGSHVLLDSYLTQHVPNAHNCDGIKQNESEVANTDFRI